MNRSPRRGGMLVVFLAVLLLAAAMTAARAEESSITWNEMQGGQVKIGGKTPIMWNLYQPDKKDKKKDSLVLILLGRRYLMLDTKARTVWEVRLSELHAQGKSFTSDSALASTSRVIPTTEWMIRDIGAAEKVNLTLDDYGGELEVQIPHPLILTPPLHYVY